MIIFISGPMNSGKSTVAALLAKKLKKAALLEIDRLREMVPWMAIDVAAPLSIKNAVPLIKNFATLGMPVVVPYPLSEKNYRFLKDSCAEVNVPLYFFTLAPSMMATLTGRGKRELSDSEKKRIKHHYHIGIPTPSFGEVIDTTERTPDEVADYILGRIRSVV